MSDALQNFVKLEMIKAFTPQQIVDCLNKMEAESNELKSAHLLIIQEIRQSNKERINILNDVMSIAKEAIKK